MENPKYAFGVYMRHFQDFRTYGNSTEGFACLELGPGDSLFSGLTTHALGGSFCHLVDIGNFASNDVLAYRRMADYLETQGLSTPKLSDCECLDDVLTTCHACYGTSGLESLQSIPAASVDFIFSHAVLEHVNRIEVWTTLKEMHRISKKGGISSHTIDLRDHLTDSLNHLRVPACFWEATAKGRNLTNRLRCSDFVKLFRRAGFKLLRTKKYRWQSLPIPREELAPEYHAYSVDDLRVAGFDIVLKA
jgi:hypothetical protein